VVEFEAWGNIWQPLVAAGAMALVSAPFTAIWGQSIDRLITGMALAAFAYFGMLLLIGKDKFVSELRSLVAYRK
jgi:hypothetical protein